ncbi:MAG: hypothetical protein MJ197_07440 [Bacteroidales bacterium]|nr:hypothetical protein [Bacteroidales bacterium]
MKKFICSVSTLLVSSFLFFGCGNEDDDVRNHFCGKYTGEYTFAQEINNKYASQTNEATMVVKKNEGKKFSVVVYDSFNKQVIFSTEGMNVISTEYGDAYCGTITAGVSEDEDGVAIKTEGVAVSADGKYSCTIAPNADGKLVLSFCKQQSYVSHGLDVVKTYTFDGVRK